jgi:hypothetical protein
MLSVNSGRPQDLASRALATDGGFGFDLGDEVGDEFPPLLLRKMLPARQRREGESLERREAHPVEAHFGGGAARG